MLFRSKKFGCTKFVQTKFDPVEVIENIESEFGGASRDRTDDLIVANDALSQLSYSPTQGKKYCLDFTSATESGKIALPGSGAAGLHLNFPFPSKGFQNLVKPTVLARK